MMLVPYKVVIVCSSSFHMILIGALHSGHSVLMLIISHDLGNLQSGHSVQLIVPHDVGALHTIQSVLFIMLHDVRTLQGDHSV